MEFFRDDLGTQLFDVLLRMNFSIFLKIKIHPVLLFY